MPDRKLAAKYIEPEEGSSGDIRIELKPRTPVDGLEGKSIFLDLKHGATKDQAGELEAMLNLLCVELRVE